jgi:hypothetical protein
MFRTIFSKLNFIRTIRTDAESWLSSQSRVTASLTVGLKPTYHHRILLADSSAAVLSLPLDPGFKIPVPLLLIGHFIHKLSTDGSYSV